jgi:[ribosomal protein S5]-alanine N-acetyltransferase
LLLKEAGISLRKFKASDITPLYLAWLNDKDYMKYSNQRHSVHTEVTSTLYLESFENSSNLFLSIEGLNAEFLGTCTVYYDSHNHHANIGVLVSPENSNRGIGKSVFRILLTQLPLHIKINKIAAGTCELNAKMISVIENSGMLLEYRVPKEFLLDGEYLDNLMYARYY